MRTQKQVDFARLIYSVALAVCGDKWKARWMTAIACLESAWGRCIPADSYNCIGYHWIEGAGWPFVETTEGGTGRRQRYRKFADYAACMKSLLYLMDKSKLEGYVAARKHTGNEWITAFSQAYCPSNKGYAWLIFNLLGELQTILEESK
jgi:flagellum-specific peptidoglycan hydrolase FlgJ